jgi:L-rhamnose mutarotase
MKRYCLALDLKNDPELIAEYEHYHRRVWPEVQKSILDSGIQHLSLYRVHDRLVMILDTTDDFSFEAKAASDAANGVVQEWETLMWKFQRPMPWAEPGEKWQLMEKICDIRQIPA